LPEALSDTLGISLSEVLVRYYSILDLGERGHIIGEAIDRRRSEEEGEECKGTSVCFLTSPIFSHSPVHMYSPSSPLYYSQGSYP
jgi:hypothetical protein